MKVALLRLHSAFSLLVKVVMFKRQLMELGFCRSSNHLTIICFRCYLTVCVLVSCSSSYFFNHCSVSILSPVWEYVLSLSHNPLVYFPRAFPLTCLPLTANLSLCVPLFPPPQHNSLLHHLESFVLWRLHLSPISVCLCPSMPFHWIWPRHWRHLSSSVPFSTLPLPFRPSALSPFPLTWSYRRLQS